MTPYQLTEDELRQEQRKVLRGSGAAAAVCAVVYGLAYPLVFGGSTLAIVYKLYAGMSYWPVVPAISLAGVLAVAVLERGRPFRAAWLTDHGDTNTDIAHTVVNLAVIQLTAVWIARLGDFVPPQWRLFPVQWPLWSQLLLVAAVFDLGLYAVHRLSHAVSWLWRLHAPHHSAERLYWLNGERRHPLHAALMVEKYDLLS
jgi:sterol desaturase/sphingolipid hydroxylase (fatty acid hydroxylase superfamily)